MTVTSCPFCGVAPIVGPRDWREEGDAFGDVACENARCIAQPSIRVYPAGRLSGAPSSAAAKREAVRRWNRALARRSA